MTTSLRSGAIHYISEINDAIASNKFTSGKSISTLGRVISWSVAENLVIIEHKNARLTVDVSLLGEFPLKIDSLFQFIGELDIADHNHVSAHQFHIGWRKDTTIAFFSKPLTCGARNRVSPY
eukprot:GEZU01012681.1.p1 GENE.GEZU01012681.1~~GEZU01012681.1.p1  ORF type:complete len:122 (+),score=5.82 GEZU01012681.1:101-466(+)